MNKEKIFHFNVYLVLLGFLFAVFPKIYGKLKTINITGKISKKEITFDLYLPENYKKMEQVILLFTICMAEEVLTRVAKLFALL